MALLPEERTQNVKASLFNYLKDNYTATPIQYSGIQFDEQNHNEWVRADVFFPTTDYFRQVGGGLFGADWIVIFNMNVMTKADKVLIDNIYRREQLVDELMHLFRIPIVVPVYDHYTDGNGTTNIGYLRTYDVNNFDLGYNEEAGLYQNNVSSTSFFLSKWDPS